MFVYNLLWVHTQPLCPLGLRNQSRGASSPRELQRTTGLGGSSGGSDRIRRASAKTAGQAPGSALLRAPAGAAPSAESRERCGGSSGHRAVAGLPHGRPRRSPSAAHPPQLFRSRRHLAGHLRPRGERSRPG